MAVCLLLVFFFFTNFYILNSFQLEIAGPDRDHHEPSQLDSADCH